MVGRSAALSLESNLGKYTVVVVVVVILVLFVPEVCWSYASAAVAERFARWRRTETICPRRGLSSAELLRTTLYTLSRSRVTSE